MRYKHNCHTFEYFPSEIEYIRELDRIEICNSLQLNDFIIILAFAPLSGEEGTRVPESVVIAEQLNTLFSKFCLLDYSV